jgi:2-dehydro-3-deoxyglucarate aldolase/4-hydroxy-2-oxoheptanedioate aldolase
MTSVIKERLAAGKIVRTMHVTGMINPRAVEMAGRVGKFHGIWVDQEHSAVSHSQLELILIACRAAGIDAFARVAPTDYPTVMRPMETGCSGVMIAQVRTMAEVEMAVQWAKYPPVGLRGFFGGNVETDFVDQIAATKGVDWLFVGPADLSVTLGVPGNFLHPKCVEALKRVSAACKTNGKAWGILSRDPEHATRCRELGCQLFSIFGDSDCLRAGLEALEQRFAPLMD